MAGNGKVGAAGRYAGQVVPIWLTPRDARQMFEATAVEWGFCRGGASFTLTADGAQQQRMAGPITVAECRIASSGQRAQPTPCTCAM